MGAGGLAGGAERQSYKVVAPGWQERAVEKPGQSGEEVLDKSIEC